MTLAEPDALAALGALAQPARLQIVRRLVVAGPDGLAAGTIGDVTGLSASGASFHLAHLERAGLVSSRREGRSVIYAADYAVLSGLIAFLMEDCCGGRPEICSPGIAGDGQSCGACAS